MLTTTDQDDTTSRAEALRAAPLATLDARTISEKAEQLVRRLQDEFVAWETASGRRKNARAQGGEKLRSAIAGFLTDLLRGRDTAAQGYVYRSLMAKSFSGQQVSHRTFRSLVEGWRAGALIEHVPGIARMTEFDPGEAVAAHRKAARFRATPQLLAICAEYGIKPENAQQHFAPRPPAHPLVLKTSSLWVGGTKLKGRPMPIKPSKHATLLEAQIKKLNEFMSQCVIGGGTHRWFTRQYSMGDAPSFRWNKGGRLYSEGEDSYQQLPRTERLKMTIDGQPLCEIDIRASYLTIIHARYSEPFEVSEETDPYHIPGIPREVVKAWCTIFFGSKKHRRQWPKETIEDYANEHPGASLQAYQIRQVDRRVCEKFPLLRRWPELVETWADLMWLESEAVVTTTIVLMHNCIPSLPVHDSLLVPLAHEAKAKSYLRTNYHHVCGVEPCLIVHKPRGSAATANGAVSP